MRLWRYARLSTLLLLLEGRAFIPSVRQLQQGDPTESMFVDPRQTAAFENLSEADRDWLLHRASDEEAKAIRESDDSAKRSTTLCAVWRRELANRRCAWAWYGADIESMALWNIYAMEGVAIGTTVERLVRALAKKRSATHAQLRAVTYLDFSRDEELPEDLVLQPYFVKQRSYAHEREIRLVCPAPDSSSSGITIEVDAGELIQEVALSPWMPDGEAEAVQSFLGRHPAIRGKPIAKSRAHRPRQSHFQTSNNDARRDESRPALAGIINVDLMDPAARHDPAHAPAPATNDRAETGAQLSLRAHP